MSTLKEERKAIVEEIGQLFADCFVNKARSWGEIKKDIDTALLSHEEKVMEREKEVLKSIIRVAKDPDAVDRIASLRLRELLDLDNLK